MELIQRFDEWAALYTQEHLRVDALNGIMKAASALGEAGILWIVIGLVLLLFKKTRHGDFLGVRAPENKLVRLLQTPAVFMLLCLGIAAVLNNLVIKPLVARPRPYDTIAELTTLVAPLSSYSFPSGHSCCSFASATALFLAFRGKGGAWAYLLAALIAVSRVYVGVHYPTDVLAGALVGTVTALAIFWVSRKIVNRT